MRHPSIRVDFRVLSRRGTSVEDSVTSHRVLQMTGRYEGGSPWLRTRYKGKSYRVHTDATGYFIRLGETLDENVPLGRRGRVV